MVFPKLLFVLCVLLFVGIPLLCVYSFGAVPVSGGTVALLFSSQQRRTTFLFTVITVHLEGDA